MILAKAAYSNWATSPDTSGLLRLVWLLIFEETGLFIRVTLLAQLITYVEISPTLKLRDTTSKFLTIIRYAIVNC
jgi:hypothetical protein